MYLYFIVIFYFGFCFLVVYIVFQFKTCSQALLLQFMMVTVIAIYVISCNTWLGAFDV